MLFKNRGQRDIESFKAMQEAGERHVKLVTSANPKGTAETSETVKLGESLDRPAIDRAIKQPDGPIDDLQSVVSLKATWEGKLRTEGSARIEGKASGEIEAGETVLIATGAQVTANIHARKVVVAGNLEGEIVCRDQLVVEQTGRLGGKVATKTLVIAEGAVVCSQIEMLRADEPAFDRSNRGRTQDTRRDGDRLIQTV